MKSGMQSEEITVSQLSQEKQKLARPSILRS